MERVDAYGAKMLIIEMVGCYLREMSVLSAAFIIYEPSDKRALHQVKVNQFHGFMIKLQFIKFVCKRYVPVEAKCCTKVYIFAYFSID